MDGYTFILALSPTNEMIDFRFSEYLTGSHCKVLINDNSPTDNNIHVLSVISFI